MKFTIKQFNEKFPTSDACLDYFWQIHFADKPCKKCGLLEGFHKLPKRPAYQCECGNQIYHLAGTPFHKSTTDLRTWFLAIFFITNTRSGMSALQFQRISGVTYKTAWRIFKQVRLMMADDETPLSNDVEVDEAYMQPNPQKRSTAKPHNSQVVFGMVERGGRARIKHVKSSGVRVLVPEIQKNIDGDEVECAIIGNEQPEASVPGRIIFKAGFYTYDAKYDETKDTTLEIPARLSEELTKQVQEVAIKAYKVLECEGMARVDMFVTKQGEVLVNEINTLPGFTKFSMYPQLWQAGGLSYTNLITRLLELAIDRASKREELLTVRNTVSIGENFKEHTQHE